MAEDDFIEYFWEVKFTPKTSFNQPPILIENIPHHLWAPLFSLKIKWFIAWEGGETKRTFPTITLKVLAAHLKCSREPSIWRPFPSAMRCSEEPLTATTVHFQKGLRRKKRGGRG